MERFAGDGADLGALLELSASIEDELKKLWMEQERMRELARLRADRLLSPSPAELMLDSWLVI